MFRALPPVVNAFPRHLNDLTADFQHPGMSTPTHKPALGTKRKQTLLSLLDALHELSQDDEVRAYGGDKPSFDDDRDVPTVDEHLQVAGAESFNKFAKRISNLDRELRNFANASRQLGSSVGILSSAFHLRERLAQILFLFQENAADLFPRKVSRQSREGVSNLIDPALMRKHMRQRRRMAGKTPPHLRRPPVSEDSLDPENFPEQLEMFACEVTTFLNCLNEFPEFTDEAVNSSIKSFEGDLKYWASCLKVYKTQFRYPAVQRYIHDLTGEMGDHLDSITSTLSMFIEIGVPTIRFAQKHGASNLLNLSTVATFFSAVTATTLQFSFDQVGSPLQDAVNAFWFSSLVFSIAAAVNSLLGLTWKQAMYRSPGHRVPWWVLIWIKRSPLVFLVFSVACFSVGLCLFTYSTHQSRVTSFITTVFTAFTSFGLLAVSMWFASERWAYNHHQGQKWLGDVLFDAKNSFYRLRAVTMTRSVLTWSGRIIKEAAYSLKRVPSITSNFLGSAAEKPDDHNDLGQLPFAHSPEPMSPTHRHRASDATITGSQSHLMQYEIKPNIASPTLSEEDGGQSDYGSSVNDISPSSPSSPNRGRFASAVRSVMMLQNASSPISPFGAFGPRRQRTTSSGAHEAMKKKMTMDPVNTLRGSRVASLIPKLKSLEPTQDLAAHQALVKHLQFSPDGKFMATSSWDRTSIIFRVGEPFTLHRVLAHPQGFVGQVAWSTTGNMLLTKLNRGIKVWTEDGVCKKTIDRHRAVQSIAWVPGTEHFMSVEGSFAVKLDLNGQVVATYHFERMKLHDVAVTPDGRRMIGVGPLLSSPSGLEPSKSRVEKRLAIYNMETKQIENQTPVLNDVRDVTIARNGIAALVSYENKAPPQLWRLEMVKDQDDPTIFKARLTLRHTFMPKVPVDFAGPSYFGGKDDEFVLCAGKAGDIHIWDRLSAVLLHHIRAQEVGGDLTCIAWNPAAENPFMFGTGSHDGAVRVWSSKPSDDTTPKVKNQPTRKDDKLPEIHTSEGPSSPAELLEEFLRTDSPIAQRSDSQGSQAPTNSENGRSASRERTVAFATPNPAEAQ